MRRQFESNIISKKLFTLNDRILLAISGGIDSVVLAHLLKDSGFNFCLVHCNFQLRGKESNEDEKFCIELAKELHVEIFTEKFDIEKHKTYHKQSTQMAARNLRYDWFKKLLKEKELDYLVTAHHAGDSIETVFINLLRGTGIKGLKGIPEKTETFVRPLLSFTKEEIISYASKNKIKFRQDQSNFEDKYERNFLRLHVIPKLKELNPQLEKTFLENSFRFAQEEGIVHDFLERKSKQLIDKKSETILINKSKLQKEKFTESILHFVLSPYGFNATQQHNILKNITTNATIGKQFLAPEYRLTITKTELVIKPVSTKTFERLNISSLKELEKQSLFMIEKLKEFNKPSPRELILNEDQLIFPLTLRTKQTGDKFRPFGMKGFKMLSDFLKEEKLNAFEKEECKLLINGNGEIIWVLGYRSDDRYKVNPIHTHLLKLTLIE